MPHAKILTVFGHGMKIRCRMRWPENAVFSGKTLYYPQTRNRETRMNDLYSKARLSRDRNFDGQFYFGVKSTDIFYRPSCPAPTAKEENVVYFNSMFEALERGFTPCYLCRPDLETEYYNGNAEGSRCVTTALEMIGNGFLNSRSVAELAAANHVLERHLRRLFFEYLEASPTRVGIYRDLCQKADRRYDAKFFGNRIRHRIPLTEVVQRCGAKAVRKNAVRDPEIALHYCAGGCFPVEVSQTVLFFTVVGIYAPPGNSQHGGRDGSYLRPDFSG